MQLINFYNRYRTQLDAARQVLDVFQSARSASTVTMDVNRYHQLQATQNAENLDVLRELGRLEASCYA